ncbi:imelysin family protein [Flavobacterium sp.]|uniref:imelysin family protein n=1 Tax=Flavobacterium sp. TaxID=239 RepID=UPI0039E7021F
MKKFLLFFAFVVVAAACSSSDNGSDNSPVNGYDRTALLTNWADNIIIPAFENYQQKVNDLHAKASTFTATPTLDNLTALRASWLEAYKAYQYVSMYYFGKAESVFLKESANTYPTDVNGINNNITSGAYNLALYAQFTRQGFPALDYLINGLDDSDAQILTFYTINANANKYKQYVTDVMARLKTNADAIVADWNGGYRNTYVANNGTTVSSSVNRTTNNFVKNFERDIRTAKIGFPCGQFSNGVLHPENVEAYYKGDVSKELLLVSLQAAQDFFNGKHFNSETKGPGLKSYLDYVNAIRNGSRLSDIINNQFDAIFATTDALGNNFVDQINSDNSKMIATYQALQAQTVYTKLDMMQALNITVDYVDGDGD